MELKRFVSEFTSNSYLLIEGGSAIVIDAGGCTEDIFAYAEKQGAEIKALFLTHTHFDHIADLNKYFRRGVPVYVHKDEADWLQYKSKNLSVAFGQEFEAEKEADVKLGGGEVLDIGGISVQVIHTPGHSPGGICLLAGGMLFTGDTLFQLSIGRYDLPGSDGKQLYKSITEKLLVLEDGLEIYPGHGEKSTIGIEKRQNPYIT